MTKDEEIPEEAQLDCGLVTLVLYDNPSWKIFDLKFEGENLELDTALPSFQYKRRKVGYLLIVWMTYFT